MNTQFLLTALAALPLGDDTPIGMLIGIGSIALVLIIAAVVMGILSKKKEINLHPRTYIIVWG